MTERPIAPGIMAAVELFSQGSRKAEEAVNQLRAHYPRPTLSQRIGGAIYRRIFTESDWHNRNLGLVGAYAAVVATCEARGEDVSGLVSFGNHVLSSLPFSLREQALSFYRKGYLWGVKLEVERLLQTQQEVA